MTNYIKIFIYQLKIPRGYVRIIGDNKTESIDSDTYGNIPYGLIESRVFLRV